MRFPLKPVPFYKDYLKEKTDKEIFGHRIIAYRRLGEAKSAICCFNRFATSQKDAELILSNHCR